MAREREIILWCLGQGRYSRLVDWRETIGLLWFPGQIMAVWWAKTVVALTRKRQSLVWWRASLRRSGLGLNCDGGAWWQWWRVCVLVLRETVRVMGLWLEFERLRLRGLCFGGKLCADESKAVYNFFFFLERLPSVLVSPLVLCFFFVFRCWNGECSVLMNAPSSLLPVWMLCEITLIWAWLRDFESGILRLRGWNLACWKCVIE